jgi:HpiC1 cyclase
MLLVLIAIVVAFIVALAFLAGATTTTAVAGVLDRYAQAQRIAESGISLAMRYIEQTADWRTERTSGAWVSDYPLDGGFVSITGTFTTDAQAGSIDVDDPSFENAIGELANPLFSPPMAGTVGGWQLQRTAAFQFGPTVPRIGVRASAAATDGSRIGFVQFVVTVDGSGTLSQTLADALVPNASYALSVDVGRAGLAALLSNYEIRLLAGGTLVASSSDPAALSLLDLDGDFAQNTIRFTTDDSPPAGAITIELHAQALAGVVSAVAFDNVRLEIEDPSPLVLTSVGRLDDASHVVQATVQSDTGAATGYRIVEWDEP